MTDVDLLPCPFCAHEGVESDRGGGEWYIVCGNCESHGPFARSESEAERLWNRRPNVDERIVSSKTEDP